MWYFKAGQSPTTEPHGSEGRMLKLIINQRLHPEYVRPLIDSEVVEQAVFSQPLRKILPLTEAIQVEGLHAAPNS